MAGRWINWQPSAVEEVMQCVRVLLSTSPGTVPLSRALGTPQDLVDQPESMVGAQLQAAVIRAVRTYEPRVKVKRVRLSLDSDGRLLAVADVVAP